jgi:galactokinase/mevalonate kinase-like predicted kinase
VTKEERRKFTSWLGKRSFKARLERFGIERLREIARENGKKGGRPKGSGKKRKAAEAARKGKSK